MFKIKKQAKTEAKKAKEAQFRKLCQLCSPNFTKEDILSSEINWPVVWTLALRHRVVPVMADRIKHLDLVIPNDIAVLMTTNVQQNLYKGLKQAAELVRLTQLFDKHHISFVVFKGIALIKLVGLDLHQRHHGDIDLLLTEVGDVWKADEHLRNAGYKRLNPPENLQLHDKQKKIYLNFSKDLVYWHPQSKIQLELHYRLFNNAYTLPTDIQKIRENHTYIKLNNIDIPVMNKSDYLFYSLVHGSISQWFRLKWLCDVSFISNNGKDYNCAAALEKVSLLGIERMVGQGLKLSNNLLSIPIPLSVKEVAEERNANCLYSFALESILSDESQHVENVTGPIDKFKTLYRGFINYDLLLRSDLMYKIKLAQGKFTVHSDWLTLHLPRQLFFLYYPLRPFLWLKRQF
jgi:hypothetical protein